MLSCNTGFGNAGKKQLTDIAPEYGITIAVNEVYDKRAVDLTDVLTKVKAADVDAVVNWSIVPAQAIVAKNMKQIGLDVPLFQSHGFGNVKYAEQAGKAGEGIIFPAGRLLVVDDLPDDHPQKEVLATYKKDYESKYGEDVSTFGGHAYDALMITLNAIEKVGTKSSKLRRAIEKTEGFAGTGGVFNFSKEDHNGLSLDAFEMLIVKDQKFVLYEK